MLKELSERYLELCPRGDIEVGRSFLAEAAACIKAWGHRAWCIQETETYGFSRSVR